MVVRIAGRRIYLWRAVDHESEILDMLVQRRRDKHAALRLMRKLPKKQGLAPKLLVTDNSAPLILATFKLSYPMANCRAALPPIMRAISGSGTLAPRRRASASQALVASWCG